MSKTALVIELPTPCHNRYYTQPPASGIALALTQTSRTNNIPLLVITQTMQQAIELQHACQFFDLQQTCLIFPTWETLPYDKFSPHQEIVSDRLLTLLRLPELEQGIVIAPMSTILTRLAPKSYLAGQVFSLRVGQKLSWQSMRQQLQLASYRCVSQVTLPGEYATRGSLFDIFPGGSHHPFRIDLLDEEIESIKKFDPETQRSIENLSAIELLPAHEFPMNEAGIKAFRQNFREVFSVNPAKCPIYEAVSRGETPPGIEYYLPLFFEKTATLFDYLPNNTIVIAPGNFGQLAEQEWLPIRERYQQFCHDDTHPILSPAQLFLSVDELNAALNQFSHCLWLDPKTANKKQLNHLQKLNFIELPDLLIQAHLEQPLVKLIGHLNTREHQQPSTLATQSDALSKISNVLFCAETEGRRANLIALLKPAFPDLIEIASWQEFQEKIACNQPTTAVCIASIEDGFIVPNSFAIIPEAALLGRQVIQSRRRKSKHFDRELIIRNLAELCIGDPIVHIDHGVGRYQGLEVLQIGDHEGEFLKITYEGGNLYVPVSNVELISRYSGIDTEHAPLHRLGSDVWEKSKRKAIEQVRDVAAELLIIYANRAAKQGFCHTAPEEHYQAFTAAFPFEETFDQSNAIEAVINDMIAAKPMDRLICGDVGFGKTEVAMRAAFLAVQSGKQVAVLVPTTLLAQQHFENFTNRFAHWPIKVDVLSRFRNAREQQQILQHLAQGQIDIIIGTHKLLSNQIQFSDLGLLVIDEEHRFGVRQKELLKKWRTDIDVLTMTATPIPRSLNMAMAAMRDLSIIATPPAKRLAIKTFVREFDWPLVREAIQRETLRGGQVYFLHNEVVSIERIADELRALVPEARIAVAHGQLPERALEQIMFDFYHHRFNVLICSTIIETGIDVPNANTIIMNRADKFGLAQLHQLRGRVGRSHHQAYAYLLTPATKSLTPDARKRLEAIELLEELGVGFALATHDLEIRGAGELLGENQSGHIQAIGYTLYTELLDRTVKAMQSGELPEDLTTLARPNKDCETELHIAAFIPDTYINDVNLRLIFYKRISAASNETELNELKVELIDRFGALPPQAKNLLEQIKLKWQLQQLGIKRIEATATGGCLEFSKNTQFDPGKLIHLIQSKPKEFKLDGPNRLKFFWSNEVAAEDRINAAEQLLKSLQAK
jgi:transcription-repair coupling factor (superfamily II helicase)